MSSATLGGELDLSDEDWQLLLQGAECNTYQKHDVVISEGSQSRRLWYLSSGSCRVEHCVVPDGDAAADGGDAMPFRSVSLGTMQPGVLFGEIGYLEEIPATASVIAAVDDTVCYAISADTAEMLFFRAPALAGRFYRFMALKLSERVVQKT
jgi:extracellular factor (EF) 3-hydroxypalmitic acid methyl ester biosynthesis protein